MFNLFRTLIPERFESGSLECPTPLDVFRTLIDKLLASDKRLFPDNWIVRIKAKGFKPYIELKIQKGAIRVDLPFPGKDDPSFLLKNRSIKIPEKWILRKERLLSRRSDMKRHYYFCVQKYEKELLIAFLYSLFRELYGCQEGDVVQGKLIDNSWCGD